MFGFEQALAVSGRGVFFNGSRLMSQDPALAERKQFLELDERAADAIRALKPFILRELPKILDAFYKHVLKFAKPASFFQDRSRMEHAKSRQLEHWERISSANFGEDYVRGVRATGEAHARFGMEPHWYIGGYAFIAGQLIQAALVEQWPKRSIFKKSNKDQAKVVAQSIGALLKAVLLDMDFSISVYIDATNEARKASEAKAMAESQKVVDQFGNAIARLAKRDFTYRMNEELPSAYHKLRDELNETMETLQEQMKTIAENARATRVRAREIGQASDDLSRRTEQQAASLEETAAALNHMTSAVTASAKGASEARAAAAATRADAEDGGKIVGEAMAAMAEISRSSAQISQIIGMIEEMAFQTNLLALNAGVEAARAGESGRGFAVVATEVRALAQRASEAAKEIKTLISTSSAHVESGVTLVNRTGDSLTRVVARAREIDELVGRIAASSTEQSTGLSEINTAVRQIDQMTQQNAAMAEQFSTASRSLVQQGDRLTALTAQFQVDRTPRLSRDPRQPSSDRPRPSLPPVPRLRTAATPAVSPRRKPDATEPRQDWTEF